jgi:hypothetical protein
LVLAYSKNTGPTGEQGVINMITLEEQNALKQISFEKFEEIKNSFYNPSPEKRSHPW